MKHHRFSFLLFLVMVSSIITVSIRPSLAETDLLSQIQNAYGSKQNQQRWNSNADLNKDGVVNLADLVFYCGQIPNVLVASVYRVENDVHVGYSINVTRADQCILSYTYDTNDSGLSWVNVTMIRQGSFFYSDNNGTGFDLPWNTHEAPIDPNTLKELPIPSPVYLYAKIYAINNEGFSTIVSMEPNCVWDP